MGDRFQRRTGDRFGGETASTLQYAGAKRAENAKDRGDEERVKAAGCDGYMCKPIDTRTFVNQIRSYLEKSSEQPSAAIPECGDPNDLLRELRNSFLAEGAEASGRYVETDCSDEIEAMRRVVHHWRPSRRNTRKLVHRDSGACRLVLSQRHSGPAPKRLARIIGERHISAELPGEG